MTIYRIVKIDSISDQFQREFTRLYDFYRKIDYKKKSIAEIKDIYLYLDKNLNGNWKAPIINDYICMIFFGVLSKLTKKWVAEDDDKADPFKTTYCVVKGI